MPRHAPWARWALLIAMCTVTPGGGLGAQGVGARLRQKVQARAEGRLDAAMERALDAIENAVKCVVGDEECVTNAEESGKKVVMTSEDGTILPPDEQPEGSPAKNEEAVAEANARNAAVAESTDEPAGAANAGGQVQKVGEGAWANYDFVPGERVLFSDDFSADRVGNFPQRLELLQGSMEMVEANGARWLRATSNGAFAVNLPEALSQRFTMEWDMTLPWWGMIVYPGPDGDIVPTGDYDIVAHEHSLVLVSGIEAGVKNANGQGGSTVDPRTVTGIEEIAGHLFRFRIHADGRYVKVYVDEHRIANIPNADLLRTNRVIFEVTANGLEEATLIGNISVNAGGRDMYDALSADGRVVTQGILFDVGSDRIRPESTPTLQQIGDMLKQHADLRLTIEGHTDSTGNPTANQTLSEKRAQAIVAYLTGTFSLDASRLQARGFGASKPAATNDTPEGRQQNRRVELVKM